MHGLSHFEKHIIRDVDDIRNGAKSTQRKTAAQGARRRADLYFVHALPHIARTERRLFDFDGNFPICGKRLIRTVGRFDRRVQYRRNFARNTEYALAVGTVRRDGDVEQIIVDPDYGTYIYADGGIGIKNKNAVDFRALVVIVVDPEFLSRTEHSLGDDAAELARLDLLNAALVFYDRVVVGKFFHLEPAGEEFIFQLFGGNFYFNVFF